MISIPPVLFEILVRIASFIGVKGFYPDQVRRLLAKKNFKYTESDNSDKQSMRFSKGMKLQCA